MSLIFYCKGNKIFNKYKEKNNIFVVDSNFKPFFMQDTHINVIFIVESIKS